MTATAASAVGWVCLAYAGFSFLWAVGFGVRSQYQERQSAEREAIGWAIVAALFWLVAK